MNDSGYSTTPLIKKLSFNPGDTVFVRNTPVWYQGFLEDNQVILSQITPATHGHVFCRNRQDLDTFLSQQDLEHFEKSVWFSWPKKASGIQTDVTEQTFRDVILPLGWVDIKVAAIDETWSGLKFTRRKFAKSS